MMTDRELLSQQLFDAMDRQDYGAAKLFVLLDIDPTFHSLRPTTCFTLLERAAIQDYDDIVELLVKKGADINYQDSTSWTALMWAVHGNSTRTVKLLVELGVDVNIEDRGGFTALSLAKKFDRRYIAELLKSAGGIDEIYP
jgi:ankyrin repeat protein